MGEVNQVFELLTNALRFVGAGISVFGAIEIFQSISENNPQAKTTGVKLLSVGIIIIVGASPLINWFQGFLPK